MEARSASEERGPIFLACASGFNADDAVSHWIAWASRLRAGELRRRNTPHGKLYLGQSQRSPRKGARKERLQALTAIPARPPSLMRGRTLPYGTSRGRLSRPSVIQNRGDVAAELLGHSLAGSMNFLDRRIDFILLLNHHPPSPPACITNFATPRIRLHSGRRKKKAKEKQKGRKARGDIPLFRR